MTIIIIVFAWLVFMIIWVAFKMIRDYLIVKKREGTYRFKQIIYKNNKKYYRIDHLKKGLRW